MSAARAVRIGANVWRRATAGVGLAQLAAAIAAPLASANYADAPAIPVPRAGYAALPALALSLRSFGLVSCPSRRSTRVLWRLAANTAMIPLLSEV